MSTVLDPTVNYLDFFHIYIFIELYIFIEFSFFSCTRLDWIAFANCGHKLCKLYLIWNKLVVVVAIVHLQLILQGFIQYPYMFFLAHKTLHESSHVLSPEPLRFVLIWLWFLLFRILYITGATKDYHFDLTLGFSRSSRSLRSTYLCCSFNFCLPHLTAIFGTSFVTICCILVGGLKPAPWIFSKCCAKWQIIFILICWYLQELIDQWLRN